MPLDKALHPDTLLATHMNGEILEPSHGYPLRLIVPGWYGVGTALQSFIKVRSESGEDLLRQMFSESRLFRLIIDEVEKTLALVDLDVAMQYAGLVPDERTRNGIFSMIREEYQLSTDMVLWITGEKSLCERFRVFSQKLNRRSAILHQAGIEQAGLVAKYRRNAENNEIEALIPLLLSINCVSAGLGWTG